MTITRSNVLSFPAPPAAHLFEVCSPHPGEDCSSEPGVPSVEEAAEHITAAWEPLPLRIWADVAAGDDWRAVLLTAACDAFEDEASLLMPWDVRFERHREPAPRNADSCSGCASVSPSVSSLPTTVPPAPERAPAALLSFARGDRWVGPPGELCWATHNVFVHAAVRDADWQSPLAAALRTNLSEMVRAVPLGHLEFEHH